MGALHCLTCPRCPTSTIHRLPLTPAKAPTTMADEDPDIADYYESDLRGDAEAQRRFPDAYPDERTGPTPEELATRQQQAQFNAPQTQAVIPPAGVAPATLPPPAPAGGAAVAAGPQPSGWGVTWNAEGKPFYAVSYPPSPEQVAARAQAAAVQAHARQVAAMTTLYSRPKTRD